MPIVATITLTDAIASYAAVVATVVLVWDFCKWRMAGPRLNFRAQAGMLLIAGDSSAPKPIISFSATNTGDRSTTITNIGFEQRPARWRSIRLQRPIYAAVVRKPEASLAYSVPYELRPGAVWEGLCDEDADLLKRIATGQFFAVLHESHKRRVHRVRLHLPKRDAASPVV